MPHSNTLLTKPLIIYRSSAGSGKTYTLTREYLRLALQNNSHHSYKRILAVTFTNKAMQEMKNRIINKLDEFSRGEIDDMGRELISGVGVSEKEFIDRTKSLLSDILHDYSHFSITTIDAFFQRVIRSFARELGVAGSYKLELDTEMSIVEVIHELMVEVQNDKTLLRWITEFTIDRLDEGKGWNVERDLIEYGQETVKEEFQEYEPKIRHTTRKDLLELRDKLKEIISYFQIQMESLAQEAKRIMARYDLTKEDFVQKKRGIGSYPDHILDKDYFPNSFVRNAVEEGKYVGSGKNQNPAVKIALEDGLQDVFQKAVIFYDGHFTAYNTAIEVIKKIYLFGLSLDIVQKIAEYKRDHDLMFISDATRFLTGLIADTDAPFIYEKMGSFYNHFLIDEFQDTSRFQWKSFRPLIENSLAEGNANLIVGDVKQSIYRWRGGELELLQSMVEEQLGSAYIDYKELRNNYRSKPSVVRFNNALFESFYVLLAGAYGDKHAGAEPVSLKYFKDIYHDVSQNLLQGQDQDTSGYVHIELVEKQGNGNEWMDLIDIKIPQIIEDLQQKGVPLREIAILVRNNRDGSRVAEILNAYARSHKDSEYRYDVVSNDSLFLSGSPALHIIIGALKYFLDPSDPVVRGELAYHYHTIHNTPGLEIGQLFMDAGKKETFIKWMPDSFLKLVSDWKRLPFIVLIDRLIHVFRLNEVREQYAFLQTFQDHVLSFAARDKGDLPTFLEWWEVNSGKESIKVADDLDAIRIMTIHKSKGLEFHSVIMPYVSWTVDHQRSPLMWLQSENSPYDGGIVPVSYSKQLQESYFQDDYHQERMKAYVDNFNMLYVALTRASHDLWIFGPQKTKSGSSKVNDILQRTLESPGFTFHKEWDKQKHILEFGEKNFVYSSRKEVNKPPIRLKIFRENNWIDKLRLKPVHVSLIKSENQIKINTGKTIHRLLSQIIHASDLDKVLNETAGEEGLEPDQVKILSDRLHQAMKDPRTGDWFDARWKVRNETAILTQEGIYRPDRVISDGRQHIIIDYKTGMKDATHHHQVKQYKELVSKLEDLPVKGYLWYLDLNDVEEV